MSKKQTSNTTNFKGPSSIYFNYILKNIIKMGNLNNKNLNILDFGCGRKQLDKLLKNQNVLNYDIKKEYSDYDDYKILKFDIVVANHVLMYLNQEQIIDFFTNIKEINNNCEIIIGIARVNWISKIAKYLLFNFNAHKNIISTYSMQLEIIKKYTKIISKKNIFLSTDIYYVKIR